MANDFINEEALAWFKRKNLKPSFSWQDVWREEHNHAFTVAKMTELDLLADTKAALEKALREGQTFKQFQESLRPELIKRGWWGKQTVKDPLDGVEKEVQLGSDARLKTIYETNMRTARSAGQWERIERNKATHPYLLYEIGPSREHRPEHLAWHGLLLPADDPFWATHYPQNGWGCKCRVRAVSQDEYERLVERGVSTREQELDNNGVPTGRFTKQMQPVQTSAPKIETRQYVNKRTGEVMDVPKGIDPGWDYHPRARIQQTQRILETKKASVMSVLDTPMEDIKPSVPKVFSTASNVNTETLDDILKAIPDAEPQMKQVFEFLGAKKTQSVFVKNAEMNYKTKAAHSIQNDVAKYLNQSNLMMRYVTRNPNGVGGFTSVAWEHVVVKVSAKSNLKKALNNIEGIKSSIAKTIQQHNENNLAWSFSSQLDPDSQIVLTWLHELGHQVHYYALAPKVPEGAKILTRYGSTNHREYHAEHFVAWVLDNKAYQAYDPIGHAHFNEMIQTAIKSNKKER